ncbi:MAG: 50S ribosomal protein L10 [bacterium]
MPRPDKVEAVKEITADLKATDIYYFVDYRGLTFSEATELRARLRKVDASLKVVKNSLARIAAADAGLEGLIELLQGPTAIAYCHGDPVQVAKTIQDFIKEKKKAAIRGGKLQRSLLTASDVERLAALPSREQLIAQVVGAIASPLTGLANVLNGPIRGLVMVLAQVEGQKANAA